MKTNLQYWVIIIILGLSIGIGTVQDIINRIKYFRKRRLI